LEQQIDGLERKLAALDTRHAKQIGRLERQLVVARDAYGEALEAWSG